MLQFLKELEVCPIRRRRGVFTARFYSIVFLIAVSFSLASVLSLSLWKERRALHFADVDAEASKLYKEMRTWNDTAHVLFQRLESRGFVSPSAMSADLLNELEAAYRGAKGYSDSVDAMMAHLERHRKLFKGTYYEGVLRAFRVFWGPYYKRQQEAHLEYLRVYREVVRYRTQHEPEITSQSPEALVSFLRLVADYRRAREEAERLEDRRVDMLHRAVSENPELGKFIEGFHPDSRFNRAPDNTNLGGANL